MLHTKVTCMESSKSLKLTYMIQQKNVQISKQSNGQHGTNLPLQNTSNFPLFSCWTNVWHLVKATCFKKTVTSAIDHRAYVTSLGIGPTYMRFNRDTKSLDGNRYSAIRIISHTSQL